MHPDEEPAARRFVDVLGMVEIDKPPALAERGGGGGFARARSNSISASKKTSGLHAKHTPASS